MRTPHSFLWRVFIFGTIFAYVVSTLESNLATRIPLSFLSGGIWCEDDNEGFKSSI